MDKKKKKKKKKELSTLTQTALADVMMYKAAFSHLLFLVYF